jgi:hypothetical protein
MRIPHDKTPLHPIPFEFKIIAEMVNCDKKLPVAEYKIEEKKPVAPVKINVVEKSSSAKSGTRIVNKPVVRTRNERLSKIIRRKFRGRNNERKRETVAHGIL